MIIRGITKADYDYVVSILDQWWGGLASERAHPVFFYEFGKHALIAELDGSIAGFLLGVLAPVEPITGYIHLVGIAPERRRRGVARALYEHFTKHCLAEGAQRIKAISALGNEGSVRFHKALGFKVNEKEDYAGQGFGRLVYCRELETSDPKQI